MREKEALIPGFLQRAIEEAFTVQVSLPCQVKASVAGASDAPTAAQGLDVLSLMGIQSSGLTGSMALGFPKATFLKILEKMIGEKHEDISSANADACSELLNIIYASARVKINESGFDFQPAIPATVCGKEISLPVGQATSFMRFQCETELGSFLMTVSLKRHP